jgi:hypothetical protein
MLVSGRHPTSLLPFWSHAIWRGHYDLWSLAPPFHPHGNLLGVMHFSGKEHVRLIYLQLKLQSRATRILGEALTERDSDIFPITALRNLATIVPAATSDPSLSWRDQNGEISPLSEAAGTVELHLDVPSILGPLPRPRVDWQVLLPLCLATVTLGWESGSTCPASELANTRPYPTSLSSHPEIVAEDEVGFLSYMRCGLQTYDKLS